jgi:hypothetical protein
VTHSSREHEQREAGERDTGRRGLGDDQRDPAEQVTEPVAHRRCEGGHQVDEPGGSQDRGRATANAAALQMLLVHASALGLMVHCPTLTKPA